LTDLTKHPIDNWCKILSLGTNTVQKGPRINQDSGMNTIPHHSSTSGTPTKKEFGSLDPRSGIYSDPLT